ncbi:hypothetical protein HBI49_089170 [Parastagonospora nodorum]|nr:hypothetical protein HBI49_089170 [Parastagonospora nodorum]KAH5499816.1 hypothetical protein HBI29_156870 [Parastagonospora nodorum]KAH5651153.1 hypothetical protein HBI51_087300 [Parastagonospora nodorum]
MFVTKSACMHSVEFSLISHRCFHHFCMIPPIAWLLFFSRARAPRCRCCPWTWWMNGRMGVYMEMGTYNESRPRALWDRSVSDQFFRHLAIPI